jgi:hypothetical protein
MPRISDADSSRTSGRRAAFASASALCAADRTRFTPDADAFGEAKAPTGAISVIVVTIKTQAVSRVYLFFSILRIVISFAF